MKAALWNPLHIVPTQAGRSAPIQGSLIAANTKVVSGCPMGRAKLPPAIGLFMGLLMLVSAATAGAQIITATPAPLVFPGQQVNTQSVVSVITLRNTSSQSVTVDSQTYFAKDFTQVGGNCGVAPFTLAPQASCTFEVIFHPRAERAYSDTQLLYRNGVVVGQAQVSGNGVVGRLTLAPFGGLNFSPTPVGVTSAESEAQLGNNGSGPVQVVSITPATTPFARVGGTCAQPPFFLAPGASCTLRYAFSPTQIGTAQRQVISIQVPPSMGTSWFLSLQGDATQGSQTITFPGQATRIYGPGYSFPVNPPATTNSGLAVVYGSATPPVCTVTGSMVAVVTAGTCSLTANQTGNASWTAAAQQTQSFAINRASQTLTFPTQISSSRTFVPGGTFAINPAATSTTPNAGQPIVYSSLDNAICTVNGSVVTMVAAGACNVAANQTGNANYNAAAQVTVRVQLALFAHGFETP